MERIKRLFEGTEFGIDFIKSTTGKAIAVDIETGEQVDFYRAIFDDVNGVNLAVGFNNELPVSEGVRLIDRTPMRLENVDKFLMNKYKK